MLPIEWICEYISNSPSVQEVMEALSSHSECDSTHCAEEMVSLSAHQTQTQTAQIFSIAPLLFAVAAVAALYATRPPSLRGDASEKRRE